MKQETQGMLSTAQTKQENVSEQKNNATAEHLTQYLKYFNLQSSILTPKLTQLSLKKLKFTPAEFEVNLQIRITEHDKDFNILRLEMRYGYFQQSILLLINTQEKSNLHLIAFKTIQTGLSNILFINHNKIVYVVKRFYFKDQAKMGQVLALVLKEYFLARLASQLDIGTKVDNFFGFDIFVYQDCIQFFSQQCQNSKDFSFQIDQQRIQRLKDKLLLLHSLKILHLDIKPDNILFCTNKEQFLFIDFGFAKHIKEELGYKSRTQYTGSFTYSSLQMRQTFNSQPADVDLYYNDMHCLEMTIDQLMNHDKAITIASAITLQQIQTKFKNDEQVTKQYDYYEYWPTKQQQKLRIFFKNKLEMLKLYQLIFNDNFTRFQNNDTKILILNNIQAVFEMISQCFNKTGEKIYNFVIQSAKFSSHHINSMINIQQLRQNKLFHGLIPTYKNPNMLFRKLSINESLNKFQLLAKNPRVELILNENKWAILFSLDQIKLIPINKYFYLFCQYIDFRSCFSSVQQKRQVSTILINFMKIDQSFYQRSLQFNEEQLCLKNILQHFIEKADQFYQKLIPQILINLIIINAVQQNQLIAYTKRTLSIPYNPLKSPEVVFNLHFILCWLDIKIPLLQNENQRIQQGQILCKTIINAYNGQKSQLMRVVKILILVGQQKKLTVQAFQKINSFLENNSQINDIFKRDLSIHLILTKRNITTNVPYFDHLMQILYELTHVDRFILHGSKTFCNPHIKIFALATFIPIESIINSLYSLMQRCFEGTRLIETFTIYYTFHTISFGDQTLDRGFDILCKNCQQSKVLSYQYQILQQVENILSKMSIFQTQKHESIQKVRQIFGMQYLQGLKSPQSHQKLQSFLTLYTKIVRIFLMLYSLNSHQIKYIIQLNQKLLILIEGLQSQQQRLNSTLLALNIDWIIARSSQNYSRFFQLYRTQIQLIRGLKEFSNMLEISSVCVKTKEVLLMIQTISQQLKGQMDLTIVYEFIFKTIKQFKLHLYSLAHQQGQLIYSFQSWYLLYKCDQVCSYLQFHSELLNLMFRYPDKKYVQIYQKYFLNFVKIHQQKWKSSVQYLISQAFKSQLLKYHMLVGLFLAVILRFTKSQQKYFHKIKYTMLKNVDYIAINARLVILNHFFSFYLFDKNTIKNKRERRYQVVKFACYALEIKCSLQKFLRHLNFHKSIKSAKKSKFTQIINSYSQKIYKNLTL